MRVSRRDDFALLFTSILAKNYSSKYIPLSFIAQETGLSQLFLKHIATSLLRHDLIKSREGIHGGYRLARKPHVITIADILHAVSKRMIAPSCMDGSCRLKKKTCACIPLWDRLDKKISSYLGGIHLSDFANL